MDHMKQQNQWNLAQICTEIRMQASNDFCLLSHPIANTQLAAFYSCTAHGALRQIPPITEGRFSDVHVRFVTCYLRFIPQLTAKNTGADTFGSHLSARQIPVRTVIYLVRLRILVLGIEPKPDCIKSAAAASAAFRELWMTVHLRRQGI